MTLCDQFILNALQLRAIARHRFYPQTWTSSKRQALRLQRKWLHAWRSAPGPKVQIGPKPYVHDNAGAQDHGREPASSSR